MPHRASAVVLALLIACGLVATGPAAVAVAPVDVVVYERWNGAGHDVARVLTDGRERAPVLDGPADVDEARVSPMERRIAASDRTGGDGDIIVVRIDGTHLVRCTATAHDDRWPSWSPDGGSLVFVRIGVGSTKLMTVAADGSAPPRVLRAGIDAIAPLYSADGTQIGLTLLEPTGIPADPFHPQVYTLPADGSAPPTRIIETPYGAFLGGWLSDGRLVVVRDKLTGVGVYAVLPDGGGWTRLARARVSFEYLPLVTAHDVVAYTSVPFGGHDLEVSVVRPDGTGRRRLTRNGGEDHTVPATG
jgi:hypothetical protein